MVSDGERLPLVGVTVNIVSSDVTDAMVNSDVPVFVTSTLSVLLIPRTTSPKAIVLGTILIPGRMPLPLRFTVSGELAASWLKTILPPAPPAVVGVNVM